MWQGGGQGVISHEAEGSRDQPVKRRCATRHSLPIGDPPSRRFPLACATLLQLHATFQSPHTTYHSLPPPSHPLSPRQSTLHPDLCHCMPRPVLTAPPTTCATSPHLRHLVCMPRLNARTPQTAAITHPTKYTLSADHFHCRPRPAIATQLSPSAHHLRRPLLPPLPCCLRTAPWCPRTTAPAQKQHRSRCS